MFEFKNSDFIEISYLDIFGRARTKSLVVTTNTSYILLANITVPAVGVGLRRVFSCHLLIVRKVKEFPCLSNRKLNTPRKELE